MQKNAMQRQHRFVYHSILLALLTVLLLGACTSKPSAPTAPEIHFGEDMCSDCGMIINDPRFAASYAAQQGEGAYETFIFDDIGDMLHHMQENLTLIGVGWWVHDYATEEWIDATTAYFLVSEGIKTPMGHGMAAFSTQAAAEEMAAEVGGEVFDWDKIRIQHALAGHHH
jgi:copper chaperone NosL